MLLSAVGLFQMIARSQKGTQPKNVMDTYRGSRSYSDKGGLLDSQFEEEEEEERRRDAESVAVGVSAEARCLQCLTPFQLCNF
jgi:hypothetical protein